MTDTPYVTAAALITVTDALLHQLNAESSAERTADFGSGEPLLTFSLVANENTNLRLGHRPFSWFIRQNATMITERLDESRSVSRADGQPRTVDLSDLATEPSWPVLQIAVGCQ